MRIVCDTNVVLRLLDADDPRHGAVLTTVFGLVTEHELFYTPQIVREVYHTCMRPKAGNGLGLSVEDARAFLANLEAGPLTLLNDTPDVYLRWRDLVATLEIRGRQAHDANLAAALLAHGVSHLLTLDPRDFARYPGLKVLAVEGA